MGNAARCHHGTWRRPPWSAEAAAALSADNTDGGNSGVAIVGSASLTARGGVINKFHLVFVVDMIIFHGCTDDDDAPDEKSHR